MKTPEIRRYKRLRARRRTFRRLWRDVVVCEQEYFGLGDPEAEFPYMQAYARLAEFLQKNWRFKDWNGYALAWAAGLEPEYARARYGLELPKWIRNSR